MINPISMLPLQLDVVYISKSLKIQVTNFLVLDGVGKSFDVFEVKTSKKWSSACAPENNYILAPYLEKRMKNKTKDHVIP